MSKLDEARAKASAWKGLESRYKPYITIDPSLIVEIGVDYGYSFFTLASDFPRAMVVGIDPYPISGEGSVGHPDAEIHVRKYIKEFPNTVLLKMESKRGSLEFKDNSIDLLHIDAIHTYEATKEDIELWSFKLKQGGIAMFHDVVSFPGTRKAFDEIPGRKVIIPECFGLGIWYKE